MPAKGETMERRRFRGAFQLTTLLGFGLIWSAAWIVYSSVTIHYHNEIQGVSFPVGISTTAQGLQKNLSIATLEDEPAVELKKVHDDKKNEPKLQTPPLLNSVVLDANPMKETARLSDKTNQNNNNIAVFYNLFVKEEKDLGRVHEFVAEQFDSFLPIHKPVFLTSIGIHIDVNKEYAKGRPLNTTQNPIQIIGRHESATEHVTLKALWDYCSLPENTHQKVVYLHSKGSFSKKAGNGRLRRFLTVGALSQECSEMPETYNICSSRFSPIPHPHVSGNMWVARCDYIQRLIDPLEFEHAMESLVYDGGRSYWACDGRGRYSAEHWVHSHPTVKPCDLYTSSEFTWNYDGIPLVHQFVNNIALQSAPRFGLQAYLKKSKTCYGRGVSRTFRINEYQGLYNASPPEDWWGYSFYKKNDDWWPNRHYEWVALSDRPRNELLKYGFNEYLWNARTRPYPLWGKQWAQLSPDQQQIWTEIFDYDEKSWDADVVKEVRDVHRIHKTIPQFEPNLSFDRCDVGNKDVKPWYPRTAEHKDRTLRSFVVEAESKPSDARRVLIIAAVPRSPVHLMTLWTQLECFGGDVDHVILSVPDWGEVYIQTVVTNALQLIPHFASGTVTLEVKYFLNNRYDVGLWCDAIQSIDSSQYTQFGLLNDSVFALRKFAAVFDNLEYQNVHMTSLSFSHTYKWNVNMGPEEFWVESVYRGFDPEGLRIFQEHSCVPEDHPRFCPDEVNNKACIINNFEHDLAKEFPCDKVYGLYPTEAVGSLATKDIKGLTWIKNTRYWRLLVDHMGFPIAKANEAEQIAAQSTIEENILAWQNNPLLKTCTAHIADAMEALFPQTLPGFNMAKSYHKRRWPNLPSELRDLASEVLGYTAQTWNQANTPETLVGKEWQDLTEDQQRAFHRLGCSMREFRLSRCRTRNQADKNADDKKKKKQQQR